MRIRWFSLLAPSLTAIGLMASVACGSSSSNPGSGSSGGGSGGGAATSCTDVCASITTTCSAVPPNCASVCDGFSEATRKCILSASSCQEIDGCGDEKVEPTPAKDSGSPGTGTKGTCSDCAYPQFCIINSSVESEIGTCLDPGTCNGSTTDHCPCMFSKGTSPCSKGTQGCSEGAANTVSCR